ncbi:hypothetical protein ACP70R_030147 [Stipagrostis hirtigluma subsp. patula]
MGMPSLGDHARVYSLRVIISAKAEVERIPIFVADSGLPFNYEEPLTEYEKIRAQNIIRNNQVLERLGVNALALLVNNVGAKRKGACNKQEEVSKTDETLATR